MSAPERILPEWMLALHEACEQRGRTRVAREIGYSTSTLSRALRGVYPGRNDLFRERVESVLVGTRTVQCPVLGEIPQHDCLDHQRLPFAATNPQRVRLYRACRSGCPHSRLED